MELALYEPDGGFFAPGSGAGRAGRDFVTSPEVGPLFGACVARALDRTGGTSSASPTRSSSSKPARATAGSRATCCAPQPRVPRRAALRARRAVAGAARASSASRSPLEPADEALGPFVARVADDEPVAVPAAGPVFASLDELPALAVDGVVLANELLDNLPFGIAEWDGARWHEVRVAVDGDRVRRGARARIRRRRAALTRVVDGRDVAVRRTRLPIPRGVEAWFDECGQALHTRRRGADRLRRRRRRAARRAATTGCAPTAGTNGAPARSTRRAAGHHRRRRARATSSARPRAAGFTLVADRTQAEWLRDLGIDELVDEGRRAWDEGARARRPRRARRPQPGRRSAPRSPTPPASALTAS